jgi:CRP/FNR family cyclic AMP-dependent transcriptional regulator
MKTNPLYRKLMTDKWFRACPSELQAALVRLSRPIRLTDGEELFQCGDGEIGLYCVLEGALLISNVNDVGQMAVLSQVEPCQWFGEIATLDQGPRHFSAHACGDTEVLFVPGEALVPWLNLHPLCWRDIGILACSKLRVALDALQEISLLSLEQRLLRRLERIASGYGSRVRPTTRVKISQEVIAQMMGVSRQSANKAMKSLEEVGLISRNYGVVELHSLSLHGQRAEEPVQVEVIVRRVKSNEQGPETVF